MADFKMASLEKTKFKGANLKGVVLLWADMEGANL